MHTCLCMCACWHEKERYFWLNINLIFYLSWDQHSSSLTPDIDMCQIIVSNAYFPGWNRLNDNIYVERIISTASF